MTSSPTLLPAESEADLRRIFEQQLVELAHRADAVCQDINRNRHSWTDRPGSVALHALHPHLIDKPTGPGVPPGPSSLSPA